MTSNNCDVAVIGGGPAGIAAAQTAASNGASVVLIDDSGGLGGHFYKELPSSFASISDHRHQRKFREFKFRQQALINSGAQILLDTRVWGIFDQTGSTFSGQPVHSASAFSLYLDPPMEEITAVQAKSLILAPGVYDRPLPFPGWELPGVLTPGAVQMQLEKQGLLPGQRILVAGSGPLQMIVAAALARQGAEVVAVLDTCSASEGFLEIPGALGGLLSRVGEGLESLYSLVRQKVPILFRHAVYRALGTPESGVQGVVIGRVDKQGYPIQGTQRELKVDTICHAYGFIPSIALTLHLGCEHFFDSSLNAFVPIHDEQLQTSIPGIFVAGDVSGAGGKPLADLQGQLAAISALERLNLFSNKQAAEKRSRLASAIRREKRFSHWLWQRYRIRPGLLELADDDTLLCRCEAVRIGQFRESLTNGGQDLFGVKLRTRLGMGQCQGRYCNSNAALFIAAQNGKPVSQLGVPSIRPPIFPVRLKDIDVSEPTLEEGQKEKI